MPHHDIHAARSEIVSNRVCTLTLYVILLHLSLSSLLVSMQLKARDLCGDSYGGFSNGEETHTSFSKCKFVSENKVRMGLVADRAVYHQHNNKSGRLVFR